MSMPKIELGVLDRDKVLNNLIASIALQEAALSHILNADGEKVQAVVNMADPDNVDLFAGPQPTIGDMEAANTSVGQLLNNVTEFEKNLRDKLGAILSFVKTEQDFTDIYPVTLRKVDGGAGLAGAIFSASAQLQTASGKLVNINRTATSDTNGDFTFELPPGTYTMLELKAPDGYQNDRRQFKLVVANDGTFELDDGTNFDIANTAAP